MTPAALALALVVVWSSSQAADAPAAPAPARSEKCKIVVLNLVGRNLPKDDDELPALLTDTLANEVGVASGCDVVSQADIVAMLDYEKQKAVCTDGSDSCLAEVGQALGADRVVAGTVGKLGGDFILAARLMNVKKGAVEQRAEESVTGAPEQLRRAAKNVGRRLFGVDDLPKDAKIDASPLPKKSGSSSSSAEGGGAGLAWTGGVIAGVGVATLVVAGALAGVAESQLNNPQLSGKDTAEIQTEGLVALGVAGAGAVVAIAGAIVLGVALME